MKRNPPRRPAQGPAVAGRRPPLFLAVLLGLGGGILLSGPLAEQITGRSSAAGQASTNLLLLGTDVSGGNTDVIALVRVDGGITSITQIPRDTYVEAERFGPVKINALFALGGVEAIKSEVGHKLGRPVRSHMVINLAAIRRMADLLGGIEVDVPKVMRYTDRTQGLSIDLQPGRQNLRGRDLEGFLRFRHDEAGDIGRLERQQMALQSLFRKITRPENMLRLPALLLAAGSDVRTDLGPMELGGLITRMGSTSLQTSHLSGRPFDLGGISYWEADWQSAGADPASASADNLPAPATGGVRQRWFF
jgi:LCP family protein required for cell wall assembly